MLQAMHTLTTATFLLSLTDEAVHRPWLAQLAQALDIEWSRTRGHGALSLRMRTMRHVSARSGAWEAQLDLTTTPGTMPGHEDLAKVIMRLGTTPADRWKLLGEPAVSPRPPKDLTASTTNDTELCLDFVTPLLLPVPWDAFDGDALALMLARSHEAIGFGRVTAADLRSGALLRHFAQPANAAAVAAEHAHASHGVLKGPIFIRDPSPKLVEVLTNLQQINLVSERHRGRVHWLGHFRCRWQRSPWLDRGLLHRRRLLAAVQQAWDRSDGSPLATDPIMRDQPAAAADRLLDRLQQRAYEPQPSKVVALLRPGKASRLIETLEPSDMAVQQHALSLLAPVLDRLLPESAFAFRAGRGRHDALRAAQEAIGAGERHVVKADIAQCFDSIPHERLWSLIDACLLRSDVATRALLAQLMRQPYLMESERRERHRGLPQGAPLSPLLVNLYLAAIDRTMALLPVTTIRYADDVLLLARTKAQARSALQNLEAAVEALGLSLAPEKTLTCHAEEGFTFLGERLSATVLEPTVNAVRAQRKPLLVTWPWLQLGANGASVEARRAGHLLGTWPLRRLSALVVTERVSLSSTMIERCLEQDVAITLGLRGGRRTVVLPPRGRQHHEALARHTTWHHGLQSAARLAIAKEVVAAKLANQTALVLQRDRRDGLADTLRETVRSLGAAPSLKVVLGHEGQAARLMFRWLNEHIVPAARPAFGSARRARGAVDRLNSTLNLGYHLLYARLSAWVASQGLNPYLGWLHEADDPYETLVYDLMEPFRPFVDRLVLRLINRRELRADDFERTPGDHRLLPPAAARLGEAFERAMGERVGTLLLRDWVWVQVRATRQLVDGTGPMWWFRWQPTQLPPAGASGSDSTIWVAEDELGTFDDAFSDPGIQASQGRT